MSNPVESDWNWFSKLPRREKGKKLPRNVEDELVRMCVWEYARECGPLIEAISKYRQTARAGRRSRKQADELVQTIDEIAGRFNWRFLCSPDFPSKAWLDLGPGQRTKQIDFPFVERAAVRPKLGTIEVEHGKGKRQQKTDWFPTPPCFSGDLASFFKKKDPKVLRR